MLTRWWLQLAFCFTACVHIARALNQSVHTINSLCASSGSLMTTQTGEFPPKCKHVANETRLQRPFSEELPNTKILVKLAIFGPGATREPVEGLFSEHGALRTIGFPIHTDMHKYICGLLMKLVTFLSWGNKTPFEPFVTKLEPFETDRLPDV